jgi:biopolymer transport protein ExbD
MSRPGLRDTWLLFLVLGICSCESKPKTNPFEVKKETVEPPPLQAPPKPTGPPEFTVAESGPKVAWTYILLETPEGKPKLEKELQENKEYILGKEVKLAADRKAKLAHVNVMMLALEAAGATSIAVSTSTRPEFPPSVTFAPSARKKSAPPCSVVAKVLSERRNAVWSLKGGTAVKSPKGMAGPDMAMTQDSLAGAVRRCKESDFVFVSGDEDVEWGLVYDLAASTQRLEKATVGQVILLEPSPTAGRPVKLD